MRLAQPLIVAAVTALAGFASATTVAQESTAMAAENPLARPSALPFGLPPFDRIHDSDYLPAFEAGMRMQLAEIASIAHDPRPPSFDNTIVALERSGQLLQRVESTFSNLNTCNTDPQMQKVDTEMAPRMAAHQDAIFLNPDLWRRVDTLYQERAGLHLDPESLELLSRYHVRFVRAGAQLSDANKTQLRQLNERISSLMTRFRQNVLKATVEGAVVVGKESELEGLTPLQLGAARAAAERRGLKGKWLIALENTTNQPLLANLTDRALRERIYKASIGRGRSAGADNRPVIAELVKDRAERAALLGYANHASYVLADESAGTPAAVNEMLRQIAPAALARAREEAAEMQKLIDAQAKARGVAPFKLEPWDWFFYSEQVRKARYHFDQAQVAPYFELEHVLHDGLFWAANQLYGLTFKERKDLPVYQPDVRVFEVYDADGKPLALFLADYFARDNKKGGAWMNSYVEQSHLLGQQPVVANHLNIAKPAAGQPVLLTFDEVTGMFHEFGHAIHGMLSNVRYPSLSGTNVPRDFVEYPSQFNEMWAREPVVVAHYAHDYRTGAPMPQELLAQVLAAQKFNQGYATLEYLQAADIDMAWHLITAAQAPHSDEVPAFELAALRATGLEFSPVQPRYHSPYFSHIFAGGYSAGYYAYLWSEVLARDTGSWFHMHGGLTRTNGDYLRRMVLSRGRSEDPQLLFRRFYGQAPNIGPLLEYRGLGGGG